MPLIKDIIAHLERIAPPSYQESYDNAGLVTGDAGAEATGAIIALDATEAVIDEAIQKGCNLVVAHHPIVFSGLKKINGKNYVEKTIIKAIRNDIAIYSIHTNLDNMHARGVNTSIAEKLGLQQTRILAPKKELRKLTASLPAHAVRLLQEALGQIHPSLTAHFQEAVDTDARVLVHIHFDSAWQREVLEAVSPHALPASIGLQCLDNPSPRIGAGLIGELPREMPELDFLHFLKASMQTGTIRHTPLRNKNVRTVAVCGGAGSFLLPQAIAQGADVYVSADFKYHEFFDANGSLVIADIGHYESEQFTIELLHAIICEKFPTFAALKTRVITNPVLYL
jgi:dinuclear metal center YbgI/SA1388 family protein